MGKEKIMKIIAQDNNTLLIRFDKDEDVIERLIQFAKKENLPGATFTIIGAAKKVTLSYYNLSQKQYEDHSYEEDMEITTVSGNISWMEDDVIIHAHGTFSNQKLEVIGGHLKSLIISATGEVVLQKIATTLTREFDEETGLNLLR